MMAVPSRELYHLHSGAPPVEIHRIPPPPHRHSSPSAPWPWIDIRDPIDQAQLNSGAPPVPGDCNHRACNGHCWKEYPQSRFPNWTHGQVTKCKIRAAIDNYDRSLPCSIYLLDVNEMGVFKNAGELKMKDDESSFDEQWNWFKDHKQGPDIRVRALFVKNLSGPTLKMLGGKYDIEPFFFSSSLNWIPSRFQEDSRENIGDHITITLPFIQVVPGDLIPRSADLVDSSATLFPIDQDHLVTQTIDTQSPLRIKLTRPKPGNSGKKASSGEYALVLDLLSVHLIRNVNGNTIISYHANMDLPTTKADYLHERIRFAGQSVYWQKMLAKAKDPTFLLLIFIWQAAYAWDEALQQLNEYIVQLESDVMQTSSLELTQRLHMIRAHLLYYSSFLQSFKKTVQFIRNTPNPALTKEQREICKPLLERECNMLQKAVERLEIGREIQEKRLGNVMNLVFSSVNINDIQVMKRMTEATVKDNSAMKQISFLTMIFLPATFTNSVFGMNVMEINPDTRGTLPLYVITMLAMTVPTVWIIIAFQSQYMFKEKDASFWKRLCWPFYLTRYWLRKARSSNDPTRRRTIPLTPYYGVI